MTTAATSAEAALVTVRDLAVAYGRKPVASLPALDVHPGECVALVGESGSGKTTSLLAILGLLDQAATVTGSVTTCGVDVYGATERQLRGIRGSRVALIMQSPQSAFNPTVRFGTLLKRALALHGVRGAQAEAQISQALDAVHLSRDLLRRYPNQVSGGQAQRFAICLAVALGAELIAADEPTSALDVTVQAEIMDVLHRLRRERGLAILLVSHDLALVSTIADHIIVMQNGRVVDQGTPAEIVTATTVPYTRELIDAVPRLEGIHDSSD